MKKGNFEMEAERIKTEQDDLYKSYQASGKRRAEHFNKQKSPAWPKLTITHTKEDIKGHPCIAQRMFLDSKEIDPSDWPDEKQEEFFSYFLKKGAEPYKKIKSLERKIRKLQKCEAVKKPRTLLDSEINTPTAIMNLHDTQPALFNCTPQELKAYCETSNFAQLANSYGFLTDAILLYLKRFTDNKTNAVSIGKFIPTAGNMNIKMDETIVIDDTMQNFCNAAGIKGHKEREQLIKEIKSKDKYFSQIGISQRGKNDFNFFEKSFMTYRFDYIRTSKLKNLKGVNKDEAIERIHLEINKDIFNAALIPGRGTKTRGYYFYPGGLERQLRDTVQAHGAALRAFCASKNYSHIKGGRYTPAIRPVFNLLIREEKGPSLEIDGKPYLQTSKPLKYYARTCCESAFFKDKTGAKKFKRQMAIEHIFYALEVLKLLWADGVKRIFIRDYGLTGDNLQITLQNHSRSKKAVSKALPDTQI